MLRETSLLHHLTEMSQHPNLAGKAITVEYTTISGEKGYGVLHATFDDGFAVLDNETIRYVPLSGVAFVQFDHPGVSKS